jgi:2-phosphoglycerate kinase
VSNEYNEELVSKGISINRSKSTIQRFAQVKRMETGLNSRRFQFWRQVQKTVPSLMIMIGGSFVFGRETSAISRPP